VFQREAYGSDPEGEAPRVQLRKVSTQSPGAESELVLEIEPGEVLTDVSAGMGGRYLAFGRASNDGKHVAILNTEDDTMETFDVSGGVYTVQASPTKRAVVFERYGQILHFDLEAQKLTELSKSGGRDRYARFNADGTRALYESLAKDPNFPGERSVSAIVSVEVP
jgi:hypothetical protein